MTTHYWWPHMGGIERVALRQAQLLAGRGHQVDVLTSAAGQPDGRTKTVTSPDRVTVTMIRAWNGLERFGVPWPLLSPVLADHARRLVGAADVVICHGQVYPATLAATWWARRLGRPMVLVQHNPHMSYDRLVLRVVQRSTELTVARWSLRRADAVLVPSSATRDYVQSLLPRPSSVLPWGIDPYPRQDDGSEQGRLVGRRMLGFPDDATVVVAAGRLTEKNRFANLVRACHLAASQVADLRCVIFGAGPQMDALRLLAVQLGVKVVLPGYVEEADLQAGLQCADIAVATAGGNEGFGLFVAEALAYGTPVVAADRGGHLDLVLDGVNGWLFDDTVEGLGATLVRAQEQIAALGREHWAERARSSAAELTWDRHCASLEAVLEQARMRDPVGRPA